MGVVQVACRSSLADEVRVGVVLSTLALYVRARVASIDLRKQGRARTRSEQRLGRLGEDRPYRPNRNTIFKDAQAISSSLHKLLLAALLLLLSTALAAAQSGEIYLPLLSDGDSQSAEQEGARRDNAGHLYSICHKRDCLRLCMGWRGNEYYIQHPMRRLTLQVMFRPSFLPHIRSDCVFLLSRTA